VKSVRLAAACAVVLSSFALGQVGPDVIVGDLHNVASWSSGAAATPIGGAPTSAFSVGTTSCNIGDVELNWFDNSNQKPVIGQNMYRLKDGRFEQIGLSWLKHGFYALAENVCGQCQTPNPNNGTHLGINCSDPYSASLNGDQGNIGPRFEVNAFTGFYPWPYTLTPFIANNGATTINENTTLAGRINVLQSDLDPALNVGAEYYVEGHYVTPDDAASGNGKNNASYRRINVTQTSPTSYTIGLTASTVRTKPAIWAWQASDPSVSIQNVDVPGEGRFVVGYRASSLGGGQYRHEYAVFNINSDRAGGSFEVALDAGVVASNASFKDVKYHSGEPQVDTDWAVTNNAGSAINWACTTAPAASSGNALRWSTLFNFGFEANSAWLPNVTVGLWKTGSPSSVSAVLCKQTGLPQTASGGGYSQSSVTYDFLDAVGGTSAVSGDDVGAVVPLPFTFYFYGQPLTQLMVSCNGFVAEASQPGGSGTQNNTTIPNPGAPNNLIAGYWDDLEVGNVGASGSSTGWCRYQTFGTAPNRRFVVEWKDAERYNTNSKVTFEIILDEGTNLVTLTTVSTVGGFSPTTGGSATRGVENATASLGTQVSYNSTGSVVALTSIRLTPSAVVIPQSALLTLSGDGSVANPFLWNVISAPSSPLSLFFDFIPGPTTIPGLEWFGALGLGMSAFLTPIADGTGVFAPLDPSAATGSCNEWSLSLAVGVDPLPPEAFDVYFQALIWNTSAPNGLAHLSTVPNY
jgi:hypothetical protein